MTKERPIFAMLQKTGKSLMLPVSVLPVAGLLLGIGSANFSWLPPALSHVMAQSGGAIFSNLPLIFAIGVALGVTQNDGVAALAAVVGYAVLLATMGVMAALFGYEPATIMGIKSIETGVFGGIAADPYAVPLLVGLGITDLSVTVPAVPVVKAQVRKLRMEDCRKLAEAALACSTAADVRALVPQNLRS